MGAKIIFKNADFQQNALIENVTDITTGVEWSAYKWQYINSSSNTQAYQYNNSLTTKKLGRLDVSNYVGRKIKLVVSCPSAYNPTTYVSNIAFASAAQTPPTSGTTTISNAVTVVEQITVPESEAYAGTKTFLLTVPTGAVYLVFSNNFIYCESPKVGLIGE